MAKFGWGGPFTIMDKRANLVVEGRAFGDFEGTFDPSIESFLRGTIGNFFQEALACWSPGILDAFQNRTGVEQELNRGLVSTLQKTGSSGRVTGVTIRLEPEMEAALRAATPASSPHPAFAPTLAPGARVAADWGNGQRYEGIIKQQREGQSLIVFSNNAEYWLADVHIVALGA